jgi:putative transcriptional regulator
MTNPRISGGTPAPEHHPLQETLASYAAGTMRAGFDLVVAAHLRTCSACRADVARLERLGGLLIDEIDPVALDENALAATLARLDEPSPPSPNPAGGLDQLLSGARRRWVAPGVWTAKVDTPHRRDDRVYLLRVAPGAHTARHSHEGAEFTQILQGALEDGDVVYRAGDFVELGPDDVHRPCVHGDETCVCLFATEGRLVAENLAGRIAFAVANV